MTYDDHLESVSAMPYLGYCNTCGKEEGITGEFGEDGQKECEECYAIRTNSGMIATIHQKINAKGNARVFDYYMPYNYHRGITQDRFKIATPRLLMERAYRGMSDFYGTMIYYFWKLTGTKK